MATIVDVARKAGVSTSTVSHVINGTQPVSPATRVKVVEAISATGYAQDGLARSLRRARSDTLGLVISDAGTAAFAEIVAGVEHEARRAGLITLLGHTADDPALERSLVAALRGRRVDGLLIAQAPNSEPTLLDDLARSGPPVVLLDRLGATHLDQVGVENVGPMVALVSHLLASRPGASVAYVAVGGRVATLQERGAGFREALSRSGLTPQPTFILEDPDGRVVRRRLRGILARRDRPRAMVAASQVSAVAALQAIAEAGLSVPDDVALATFDDFPFADLFSPRLTAVSQPAFAIGRDAVRLLLRRLKTPAAPPRTIRLRPRIVHRESCGCGGREPIEWNDGHLDADEVATAQAALATTGPPRSQGR